MEQGGESGSAVEPRGEDALGGLALLQLDHPAADRPRSVKDRVEAAKLEARGGDGRSESGRIRDARVEAQDLDSRREQILNGRLASHPALEEGDPSRPRRREAAGHGDLDRPGAPREEVRAGGADRGRVGDGPLRADALVGGDPSMTAAPGDDGLAAGRVDLGDDAPRGSPRLLDGDVHESERRILILLRADAADPDEGRALGGGDLLAGHVEEIPGDDGDAEAVGAADLAHRLREKEEGGEAEVARGARAATRAVGAPEMRDARGEGR